MSAPLCASRVRAHFPRVRVEPGRRNQALFELGRSNVGETTEDARANFVTRRFTKAEKLLGSQNRQPSQTSGNGVGAAIGTKAGRHVSIPAKDRVM